MIKLKNIFFHILYSFPVQLFLVLVKKNQFLLFYWIFIVACVTGNFGVKFGIPYLFLDPEYLGSVDFRSMYIMGFASGGFIMSFTISSYILNGFRFPFMAALARPFQKYYFNSLPIHLIFLGIYLFEFCHFQLHSEFKEKEVLFLEVISFLLGTSTAIILTLSYFFGVDKNVFKISKREFQARHTEHSNKTVSKGGFRIALLKGKQKRAHKEWRVDSYFVSLYKARLTRGTEHYDRNSLALIAKRNHVNAAMMELVVFILILILGLFRDNIYFRIPAAASILLLLSMVMMLTSAYRFWMKGWTMSLALIMILIFNQLSQNNYFNRRNQAYGMDYGHARPYNIDQIKQLSTPAQYSEDSIKTIAILEKWKMKNISLSGTTNKKPVMVFVCSSGGGLRSAMWSLRVLQVMDSLTQGKLISSTQLMTGASGGSIGSAFFRELVLQGQNDSLHKTSQQKKEGLYSVKNLDRLSRDLLNPIAISITVNDIFFGFQSVQIEGKKYKKDRAYEFEKQLNENTGQAFSKKLRDYELPESEAKIPMMIFSPTIVNDGRRLFISPQPISYLTSKNEGDRISFKPVFEGVEFTRLFKDESAMNVNFSSVLRMSATFPYVMPTVSLPSNPPLQLMDAGMRDNFGLQTSIRFLYVFRKWISENTDGVLILQIRDTQKESQIENKGPLSLLNSLTTPLETFYNNFAKVQDYNQDELLQYAGSWYNGKIDFVSFQLPEGKEKASLSWHLTTREKQLIYHAINLEDNQEAVKKVRSIFE